MIQFVLLAMSNLAQADRKTYLKSFKKQFKSVITGITPGKKHIGTDSKNLKLYISYLNDALGNTASVDLANLVGCIADICTVYTAYLGLLDDLKVHFIVI
jgi:hypothetical protein